MLVAVSSSSQSHAERPDSLRLQRGSGEGGPGSGALGSKRGPTFPYPAQSRAAASSITTTTSSLSSSSSPVSPQRRQSIVGDFGEAANRLRQPSVAVIMTARGGRRPGVAPPAGGSSVASRL